MTDHIGQQFGHYRLLRLLGAGAFASVYLGEHQYLERPAAVKVLHVQMESQAHATFLREARTIARLDHPHIVRVLDFGIADQTPYLVMEYTPNGTLRTQHPKGTRLSLEQIVTYVKQIASALDYAHGQHVIHRDVKPENLLLNAKGEIVLSDFGIAVVHSTLDTLSGQNMAGTPLYMAPEQIQRHPCPASDQYALGVMVYEWLCGKPPFPGPGAAIFGQHLYQDPPGLCARVPELPPAVEDAIFGALAKDPAQRFTTIQDFAATLEEACFATQPLSLSGSSESTPQELDDPTLPLSVVNAPNSLPAVQPVPPLAELHQFVAQQPTSPVSVICVCAPADRALLEHWEAHLRPLEQAGTLTAWSESHLLAGSPRQQQIDAHLEQADFVVLLLSADFFSSDECIAMMEHALSRQRDGRAHVVPLLLRPVEWHVSPLASLSCVPSNHLPVTAWTNRDAAFDWCVRDICRLLGRPVTTQPKLQLALSVSSTAQRNRKALLRKVRSFWIEGVLEHSLHGATLMTLGLQAQPDAVANPWHLVLQQPETTPQPLPAGTRITQVYDATDGELLILGAPGAGKTTLILELARDLLARAEQDDLHPMPVVFNLSSWAMKQQPLADWLVAELNTKYQVPSKLAQALLSANQILPLLDGLDEVAPAARTACIEAINIYRREHGLLPLVVCGRQADYLSQAARVLVHSAVLVQPLTQEQVDTYLAQEGEPLWALRVALHQDATLRELTSTPLMLSILTLTYHGKSVEELLRGTSIEERQRQIFEQYVRRMLTRRGPLKAGTTQQVVQWLTYLAGRMRKHNQTVFYLEQMQPDWLVPMQRRNYALLAVRLPAILVGIFASLVITLVFSVLEVSFTDPASLLQSGAIGGLLGWLFSRPASIRGLLPQQAGGYHHSERLPLLSNSLPLSIVIGLIAGLSLVLRLGGPYEYELSSWLLNGSIFTVVIGLSSLLLSRRLALRSSEHTSSSRNNRITQRWKALIDLIQMAHRHRALLVMTIVGVGYGLSYGLSTGLSDGLVNGLINGLTNGLSDGLNNGLPTGLSFGLISVLVSLTMEAQAEGIVLAERLQWTWKSLMRSLLTPKHVKTTLLIAGMIGVPICLSFVLFFVVVNGLSTGLINGLTTAALVLGEREEERRFLSRI
jgi:serine/threonine protein kinase/GTPase SAR1 family protein